MSTLGITNLKKAVGFGLNFAEEIVKAGEDGFTWTDSFGFIDEVAQIPGILQSGDEIVAEIKDLDEAEKVELAAYAAAEFDIADDQAEAVVEKSLNVAFSVIALVNSFKTAKG